MFAAHSINAEHRDLIHDVAFDHYGLRMASCSSDQFIKVWEQDSGHEWKQSSVWKAHSGPVWKVTWAHPEFGQVIASCSFDRTVAVWEEIISESSSGMRNWARRTNLVDSRTSVTDVKFAPKALGLMLATCSVDGIIRIYEAPDVMNLSQWTLQHEVATKLQCSCISWNPVYSRPQLPMLAVGSDDVTSGGNNKVIILQYSEYSRRWSKVETLSVVNDPIHDIAFAPRLGRSYDLLAVATKDVRIFTLTQIMDVVGSVRYEVQMAACFDDHNSSVWRVCWNNVGSIVASSGDDGCVRMWRCFPSNHENLSKKRDLCFSPGKPGPIEETELEKPHKTVNVTDYGLLPLGLKSLWKCAAIIKGDGRVILPSETAEASEVEPCHLHTVTTRYFKLASISHPTQVPWH